MEITSAYPPCWLICVFIPAQHKIITKRLPGKINQSVRHTNLRKGNGSGPQFFGRVATEPLGSAEANALSYFELRSATTTLPKTNYIIQNSVKLCKQILPTSYCQGENSKVMVLYRRVILFSVIAVSRIRPKPPAAYPIVVASNDARLNPFPAYLPYSARRIRCRDIGIPQAAFSRNRRSFRITLNRS
jgi:hypothetical protein